MKPMKPLYLKTPYDFKNKTNKTAQLLEAPYLFIQYNFYDKKSKDSLYFQAYGKYEDVVNELNRVATWEHVEFDHFYLRDQIGFFDVQEFIEYLIILKKYHPDDIPLVQEIKEKIEKEANRPVGEDWHFQRMLDYYVDCMSALNSISVRERGM